MPGALLVGLELRETYGGVVGAADLDVEPTPCLAPDGVGVVDGTQVASLDTWFCDVLRDGDHVELLVGNVGHRNVPSLGYTGS